MSKDGMRLDTKQIAKLALSRLKRQDVDIPGDALHELEHEIKKGIGVMEEDSSRSPRKWATSHAEEALVNYASWQYLNTPKTAEIAQSFRAQYKDALRRWERAAAREQGRKDLEENPHERTSEKIKREVGRSGQDYRQIRPDDTDPSF